MLDRIRDISGLVRDIGVIIGVPTIIGVGVSLYDLQTKALEQQVKANEAQIHVLEAQNNFLKETQFDRASALIKGQRDVYEAERAGLLKQIADLRQAGDQRVTALEEQLRQTTNAIRQSDVALKTLETTKSASGRNAIGVSPEELATLTKALAEHAETAALDQKTRDLANQLEVTQGAMREFLRVLGEQGVPPEQLAAKLTEIASNYRILQQSLNVLDAADDPTAKELLAKAKAEINAGRLDAASATLQQAEEAEIAAAAQAKTLGQRASAAANSHEVQAAANLEHQGDIALTQGRNREAADFFRRAAALIPASKPDERQRLLRRQAEAIK